MARSFAFGAATRQGHWPCLEDGYFFDPILGLGIVTDGFGGRGAGDLVSRWLIDELRLVKEPSAFLPRFQQLGQDCWKRNENLPRGKKGGCSALAFIASRNRIELAAVGAMTAHLIRENRIISIWSPQVYPKMDHQPAYPTEGFGLSENPRFEQRDLSLRAGDLFLVGSGGVEWGGDGLLSLIQSQTILRSPGDSLAPLLDLILDTCSGGSPVNATLLGLEG